VVFLPRPSRSLNIIPSWIALVAWSGLIWALSSIHQVPSAGGSGGRDYVIRQVGHLALHAVLALLAWRATTMTWGRSVGLALPLGLAALHSVLDEVYQYLIPGRDANFEDVLYNLGGVLVALLIVRWLSIRSSKMKRYLQRR